ncbi:MAG: hypothetical protein G01um101418_116 [Parcubacteria group bacterium Gr01-1014_18]|nr:MAG: hypothetical protein Greene041636_420 [Parcubacteria group bacterium Greene0416_36]TSC81443.1 MAG: hypothetical protein G01um101418_116 [Parcubacteria group bacterium Gr01-1014_18]TSC99041.1 MAG: hypothetical protein Greene101420_397 [Parcubacteria group bacterium Greene1014_20]TSD07278.1 MAG: hypothetical protein Greene07142_294 [Parcubacteria group bacterium Greene0714_2]
MEIAILCAIITIGIILITELEEIQRLLIIIGQDADKREATRIKEKEEEQGKKQTTNH